MLLLNANTIPITLIELALERNDTLLEFTSFTNDGGKLLRKGEMRRFQFVELRDTGNGKGKIKVEMKNKIEDDKSNAEKGHTKFGEERIDE